MADDVVRLVREDRRDDWNKWVEEVIALEPGDKRDYELFVLSQTSGVVAVMAQGLPPERAVKIISGETTLIQVGAIIKNAAYFSPRGEELRLWWNEWHDRVHPHDVNPPLREEDRQRAVFNPSEIRFNGARAILAGLFDPSTPITKNEKYGEIVKRAVEGLKASAAAEGKC